MKNLNLLGKVRKSKASTKFLFILTLIMLSAIIVLVKKEEKLTVFTFQTIPLSSPTPSNSPLHKFTTFNSDGYDNERGLIKENPQISQYVNYYQIGTVQSGKYQGYKKIAVAVTDESQMGGYSFILATNDDQIYILEKDQSSYLDSYYGLNKLKITSVDDIDNFPNVIYFDNNFALYKSGITTHFKDIGVKDDLGNEIQYMELSTDTSKLTELPSDNKDLSFYYEINNDWSVYDNSVNSSIDTELENKYVDAITNIIVSDNQGLLYTYYLTNVSKAQQASKKETDSIYTDRSIALNFKKSEINSNLNLYNNYSPAFSNPCTDLPSVMKNISDDELTKVGSLNGADILMLKDSNHPLYTLLYNLKSAYGFSVNGGKWYSSVGENPNAPSLNKYISTNPLFFIKDPWGRLIAFGESYYTNGGGCGKPVIYLYPTKTTKVSVQFTTPMSLTTDIPTYHDGWNVLANPDGKLKDLQPQYTNCNLFNLNQFGSEYASEACNKNSYPYLYWAGKSDVNQYPREDNGWVISKDNLDVFLNKTLSQVGLNDKEKSDMLSYWIPEMLSKNTPFYKISFLQTTQMNQLAPMKISPKPDTLFRIFLDWSPLLQKPSKDLIPEHLNKLQRNGFTVVEWGGLKQ